nr:F-box domain, leucine-rich repeat domain, L domain-like protein [Tanacetum cinerariifolium]
MSPRKVAEDKTGSTNTSHFTPSPHPGRAKSTSDRRCQQMLPGPTAVTVEVRIGPLHTMYPAVAWVALLTEAKANESPIWAAGQQARQDPKPFLKGNHRYKRPRPDPTQFDLRPYIESPDCTEINAGIQQHLQKAYNTNKAAFKGQHWVIDPITGRRKRPENIIASEQTSTTQEYPSVIGTFFVKDTVNEEFLGDEDRRIYAMGTYTDDEINRLARGGKQRGHIADVGRVLPAQATASPSTPAHESTLNSLYKKVDFMMSLFKSDSKYSDMFSQFESGGASGSGGCGDEVEGADHQDDEDEDGDGDT